VRRVLRAAVWAAVFLGAAGIGAYVAAHTEVFPPAVEAAAGTTSSPSPSATDTPVPQDPTWQGVIRSSSYHDLYVGGRCTTHWVTRFTFETLDNGKVVGTGTARLHGRRECTFPNAQIQAERILVSVVGDWNASGFSIRLNDGARTPKGTADYGGFAPTVFVEGPDAIMDVHLDSEDTASAAVRMQRLDDQGRGRYVSVNHVSLTLRS
jgi:hypothetical protein